MQKCMKIKNLLYKISSYKWHMAEKSSESVSIWQNKSKFLKVERSEFLNILQFSYM